MKVSIERSKTARTPAEFKVVRLRECPVEKFVHDNPARMVEFWRKHVETASWFKEDKECLVVILLNTRRQLVGFELVSQGTLNAVVLRRPEVFRLAAMKGVASIVIAHNHPSGDPSPSDDDIKITRDLINAGQVVQIELVDHIVIGDKNRDKSYCSLRELGCFEPEPQKAPPDMKARHEVDEAVTDTVGFLELVADRLAREIEVQKESDCGQSAAAGIYSIANSTAKRLMKARDALFESAREQAA